MENKQALTVQEVIQQIQTKDPRVMSEGLANMTVLCAQGENCSAALPSVAKLMSKQNVSLIRRRNFINAKYVPDDMSTVSNVFASVEVDFQNPNPIIKAIAVKQAGIVANEGSIEKMAPIIKNGAIFPDPFVRKTAALSILKLFHASPYFITRFGFAETLLSLLRDESPIVASNAAAAIAEINSLRTTPLIKPELADVGRLLMMVKNLSNDWAKINIFNFAASYTPSNSTEALNIIKVIPQHLANSNSAVTVAAIRVLANMTTFIDETAHSNAMRASLKPLIVLMNNPVEIQYVMISCILTILQRFQGKIFNDDSLLPKFFVKEEDPLFIKLQKLDILFCLMSQNNVLTIVNELANYARTNDEQFVRKTIQIIGKIAVLSPTANDRCVEIIEQLLPTKVPYCIQECISISANIIRKYHDKYQRLIPIICQNMPATLDDDNAKATLAWIIGEDSAKISNQAVVQRAHELIDTIFVHNYQDESPDVQLAIMAAVVKIFLTNPSIPEIKAMAENILSLSINNSDNPDIRDRAFFYLNIINDLGERALDVIASQEEQSLSAARSISPDVLIEALIPIIGTMATIYAKFPSEFVPPPIICDDVNQTPTQQMANQDEPLADFSMNQKAPQPVVYPILASSTQENFWTEISGQLDINVESGVMAMNLKITNNSKVPLEISRIVIKVNTFDIAVKDGQTFPVIESQQSQDFVVLLTRVQPSSQTPAEDELNIAIVCNRPSHIFFGIPFTLQTVLLPESYGKMTKNMFAEQVHLLESKPKPSIQLTCSVLNSATDAREVLHGQNLVFLGTQGDNTIFTACSISQERLIIRISCMPNGGCNVEALCMNQEVAKIIVKLIVKIIA